MSVCVAREWAIQLAAGLAHVHAKRAVHRDINPVNVLVYFVEGAVVVKANVVMLAWLGDCLG